MKSYSSTKRHLLKDRQVRQAYDSLDDEFAIVRMIIKRRLENGMTQAELAKKVGTKQSAIARLESGTYNPSIAFLKKVAKALGGELLVTIG